MESRLLLSLATTTTLAESAATLAQGQTLTLTASVSDGDPVIAGTVTFTDGSSTIGTGNVSNGTATLTISSLAAGKHQLRADYGGTVNDNPSMSNSGLLQTIASSLSFPTATAVDAAGDVYIADSGNNVVRKVTPGGVSTVVAGNGTGGYTGDGAQATSAELFSPQGLAIDSSGNLYIADSNNNVIRMVTTGGVISTFAGNSSGISGHSGNGGQATAATLYMPGFLTFDSSGNLYIADYANNEVRKVTTGGVISDYAGNSNGTGGSSGNGGQATAAALDGPQELSFDSSGNLYIVDLFNAEIRKVTPGGVISDFAGTGSAGFETDGGQANATTLNAPYGVAVDSSGNVYISDAILGTIRKVASNGVITKYAGTGSQGYGGDGGPPAGGTFNYMQGLTFDPAGNLIIADGGNNAVREVSVTLSFTVTAPPDYITVSGIPSSVSAGSIQTITVTDHNADNTTNTGYTGSVHFTSTDGQAILPADATLTNGVGTFSVTFETAGTQSVTATDTVNTGDTGSEASITVTPAAATVFTVSNGAGVTAGGVEPESVTAYDAYGNIATNYAGTVHVTSSDPQAVLPPDATLTNGVGTFNVTLKTAGSQSVTATDTLTPGITGSQGGLVVSPGSAATFDVTGGASGASGIFEAVTVTAKDAYGNVATGYAGTVHITSTDGSAILPPNATLTNGVGSFGVTLETQGIQSITATDTVTPGINGIDANLSIAYPTTTTLTTSAPSLTTVQALTLTATVATIGGQPAPSGGTVTFYQGPTVLGTANVVAGTATFTINRLASGTHSFSAVYGGVAGQYLGGYAGLTGQSNINTVAGTGTQGNTGDGGLATAANLNLPSGIVFDAAGNVYIADPGAHVVRKVTPAGIISTYAGTGTAGYTGDAGQATAARLYAPYGLAIDAAGDLFVADNGNNTVRKITPGGVITTIAGNGTGGSTGNGGQATAANLDEPTGVAVDSAGDVFIADSYNNEIREVTPDGVIHDFAGTGTAGNTGDGGQATSAQIHDPYMVAVYGGNVYFTDFGNNKVREVTTDGVIHDFAGNGTGGDTGDGGAATAAEIDGPIGLAFNAVGDLFIANYDDSTVRMVTTDGKIQTVAGSHDAFQYGSSKGDGGPGSAAGFYYLQGLAVDAVGNLYIADNYNASIRELGQAMSVNVTQAPATHYSVTASPANAAAGTQQAITVTALDADGNVVTNYSGTVHFSSNDNQAVLPVNAALTNGVGTFNVTLETAGTDSVTATDTSTSITGSDAIITVTPAAASHFVVVGGGTTAAGVADTVTVTALDSYGNIDTNYGGTVAITSSDGQAVLPAHATLTGGVGTFNVTLKTAGSRTITATDMLSPGITGTEADVTVTPVSATHFLVTGATSESAGGVETVTVTAYDPFGNIATGYTGTVHITSTDGQAILPADAVLTGGVGTFDVTLKTAGSDSITATDALTPGITGIESAITVTPAAASTFAVTSPGAATAGVPASITVTARDTYGNIATGYAGIVHLASSDSQALLPNDATLTNGVGTFDVSFRVAGNSSVTATDTVISEIHGTSSVIAVAAAPASQFVVTGGAEETAGGVETVTVTAYDAFGNVATGYTGMVHITSSDAHAILPADATLTGGVGTFQVTLKTAGAETITATDAILPGITGTASGITVTPAAASHFVVTGGLLDTAGGVEPFIVTAYDTYGNIATGYTGIVHLTSSDGQAVLPVNSTLIEGVGTFDVSFKTAGSQSITATDIVIPGITGTETGLTVSPAAAASLTITSSALSGSQASITVTAFDAYGNVATGYTGSLHFTSSDAGATLPADSTLTAGVGTFLITFSATGTPAVTATDSFNGGLTASMSIDVTRATSQAGSLVSSAPRTFYGQDVVLTATFSANAFGNVPMTGTVSFYDGTTFLGTVALTTPNLLHPALLTPDLTTTVTGSAVLTTTALGVGDHLIRAVYSGDANYSPATSQVPVTVQVVPTVTSTNLTISTTTTGSLLTANVAVTSGGSSSTSGSVSFYDNNTLLGTSTVVNGVATFNLATTTPGQHTYLAVFSGGASQAAGSSATITTTSGTVYLDLNANGVLDAGEPGLAGRVVFLDLNHDGTLDAGDPTATTDSSGNFVLNTSVAGTFAVVEATSQDTSLRHVIDQTITNADGSVSIGVVPFSPVAPVPVVPSPFSTSPSGDANTAYVQSLYKAVLGRTGADGEVATWLARLNDGMTRQQVAVGFINSTEHRQDQVNTYYEEFLHRAADPGSSLWVDALLSGMSEEQVVKGIIDSPEYQDAQQDPTLFVQGLYLDVLGRQGESGGVTGWVAALASGASRADVVAAFVQSTEAVDQVVDGFYTAYLHRQPEAVTSNIWVTILEQPGGSATDVATGILASPEFDQDAKTSQS